MQMKTGVLIGLAMVLAGVTFFMAKMWLDSTREGIRKTATAATKQKQIQTAEILVAKVNLPAGTRLKREHLEWRIWPKKGVMKTQFVKGDKKLEEILGYIVRRGILAGEPLVTGRVVQQGDRGYMAALLDPGMQAVSIKVSKTASVAGFIKPGDRVDVLLTLTGKSLAGKYKKRRVTETMLADVLIIAIEAVTNDQGTKPSTGKTITLQVTPKQAQIFTVAQRVGSISLVLRSLAREDYIAADDAEAKDGKTGKSGKKDATSATNKDAKMAKDANMRSSDKAMDDESAVESAEPVTPLRTWDSEVSEVLVQLGGRKTKVEGFEVIRGNKSQRVFIFNDDIAKNTGDAGKNLAKKSATGFQAGQRAAGTAASTLR